QLSYSAGSLSVYLVAVCEETSLQRISGTNKGGDRREQSPHMPPSVDCGRDEWPILLRTAVPKKGHTTKAVHRTERWSGILGAGWSGRVKIHYFGARAGPIGGDCDRAPTKPLAICLVLVRAIRNLLGTGNRRIGHDP
ncbi:MAG: hypothetical protein VB878_19690, partial [Pirellulaceae bacterium]